MSGSISKVKASFFILSIFLVGFLFFVPKAEAAFTYSRTITIDHTKVPSTDQTDFPVLISGTYSYLATTGNGGLVTDAQGDDVGFYTNSNCSTGKMAWEVEKYTATTGEVIYWVKVATVDHDEATVFYMCYGDASITTDQSAATSVWNSAFKGVWHLPDGSSLTALDSTSSGYNGTNTNTTATTGQIGGGGSFGATKQITTAYSQVQAEATFSAWIKPTTLSAYYGILYSRGTSVTGMMVSDSGTRLGFTWNNCNYPWNGAPTLTTGSWQYVAIAIKTTGLSANAYQGISGSVSSASDTIGCPGDGTTTLDDVKIGLDEFGSRNFDGLIDEVRISNVQRSADWITTEYNNQYSPSTFYAVGSEVSAGITISGTLYTNEGSSALDCSTGGNRTVRIKVNGAGTYSADCTLNTGAYSVSDVTVAANDVVTVFLDGESEDAVAVTRAADSSTNITGLNLYQNYVIVRHEDSGPITNANLDQYDSGGDADIGFAVASSVLTVASGNTLYVWTGKTFTPGGNVTTPGLKILGTYNNSTSNPNLTLSGNLTINSGGTFTKGSGTLLFSGGTTQTITDSNGTKQDLGNVQVSAGAGAAAFVQTKFAKTYGGNSIAVTFDSSVTVGNIIAVQWTTYVVNSTYDHTLTDNKSNTYTSMGYYAGDSHLRTYTYYTTATTGGSSFTVTLNFGHEIYGGVKIIEISGASLSPSPQLSATGGSPGASMAPGSLTAANSNSAYLAHAWTFAPAAFTSPGGSWTYTNNYSGFADDTSADARLIGSGAQNPSFGTASDGWVAELATFEAATVPTTVNLGSSIKVTSLTIDTSQTLSANGSNTLTLTGSNTVTWCNISSTACDSTWLNRRKITFDNSALTSNLTDFPVLVSLTSSNIDYSKTQSAGQDIRFVDHDGAALSYEIEKWDESGTSLVWVKVPQLDKTNSDYIYMYYNNTSASDGQAATSVWDSNFKAVYHMHNTASPATDSTSNAKNATQSGGVTFQATGQIGKATSFDEGDDYLNTTIVPETYFTYPFTMSFWGKLSATDTEDIAFGYSNDDVFTIDWTSSTVVDIETWDPASGANPQLTATVAAKDTNWRHMTVVLTNKNTGTVYLDGTASALGAGSKGVNPTGSTLLIGGRGSSKGWSGIMDETRISSVARSADWVKAEYNNANGTMNTFASEETYGNTWTNNGTFTGSTGTVTFAPSSTSIPVVIGGSSVTTFNNLTSTTVGATLQFKAGQNLGVAGAFTITGTLDSPILIQSDSAGTKWNVNFSGTAAIKFALIKDSGCAGGTSAISIHESSTSQGNNTTSCWVFVSQSAGSVGASQGSSGGGTPATGGGEGGSSGGSESGSGGGTPATGGGSGGGGGGASP